jgi:hypothetical protein
MRLIVTLLALAAVGCAAPPVAPAPPGPSASSARTAPQGAAPAAVPSAPVSVADSIADAKKKGYTLVNHNGEEVVCRTQLRTGSRLQKDTYCFTPAEYEEMRRRTEQGLANTEMQTPPPQFK